MNKILDTINSFLVEKNQMIICCNKNNIILIIKNGSVVANIVNEFKKTIGINEIDINDQIIILYKDIEIINGKNYIKPIKIIKQYKYAFNYDTNSDNSDYDIN
jgi:hypothetical protein